ncbi:DUF5819 family protein [Streptomyces sp. NPDC049577]|uniref:DUF5819 family protein n=1 Tax=Streptomyces sp. NPDC049577 TaxID=3155153 RepID=UPI0034418245
MKATEAAEATGAAGAAGAVPAQASGAAVHGARGGGDEGDGLARLAGLSLPARLVVAGGTAVVAVATAVHLAMVFLHVAPPNTVSKQHAAAIDDYVYPEFEQNWKFFAPNPLQQNVSVQARAELGGPGGRTTVTPWTDLSAQDGAGILHQPFPSHTKQNELRRAWDFYASYHDANEQPSGLRGRLSEQYVRRIVVSRLTASGGAGADRPVERVQVRVVTAPIAPPPWSDEKTDTKPVHRELGWWPVTTADHAEVTAR